MTISEYNRSAEEHADSVYRFIRDNLKDEERANDIVQDSYERLWRHVAEIEYPCFFNIVSYVLVLYICITQIFGYNGFRHIISEGNKTLW